MTGGAQVHNGGAAADGARVREGPGDVHHVLPAGDAHRPRRRAARAAGEGNPPPHISFSIVFYIAVV